MKKFALQILFALSLVFMVASCEKCVTCTSSYTLSGQEITATTGEICGSSSEIDESEEAGDEAVKAQAALVGGTDASYVCTEVD